MNTQIQEQITNIITSRQNRLNNVKLEKHFWEDLASKSQNLTSVVQEAENLNPVLMGITEKIRGIAKTAKEEADKFSTIVERFSRQDICIGIGGAGRMGKSTFLQAVTGLGEQQIPTSDMYYTTAGRSLIVNSTEAIAIADMHTPNSFISKVIAPMCKTVEISAPSSIAEFKNITFPLGENQTQMDVIKRLEDTQKQMFVIEPELTGEKERRIEISNLRDYVAYPENGQLKAGKFMAISNIVIYAPFPSTEVQQLRVMDLPGLGEAGRDLAEVQTSGMEDICDITLLMKRPDEKNVAWNFNDSSALDAMKNSSPLLDDQTKYTAILANVDGGSSDRADACIADIRNNLQKNGRNFDIIRCNAKDREQVISHTMPEILSFLAKNLPLIDDALFKKAYDTSTQSKKGIISTISSVKDLLSLHTKTLNGSIFDFKDKLFNNLLHTLNEYSESLAKIANEPDEIWNEEVRKVSERVKKWIENGCGFESKENLITQISDEYLEVKGQPSRIVNQLRIAYRKQWEVIDEHLQKRIADLLEGFVDRINQYTNSFIPAKNNDIDKLTSVRKQLLAIADKLLKTPNQDPGDDSALQGLATPLQRLSEFDLRFRFHLEPTLIASTEVIISNKLPGVNGTQDATPFADTIMKMLLEKTDEYARTMCDSRAGNKAFEKKKRLIENAVKDPVLSKELIKMLENVVSTTQSFNPNRIFAAVIQNAEDAFLRFKDKDRAFAVWIRGYEGELREDPSPAEKAIITASIEVSDLKKYIGENNVVR